ncbi:MAG TPA: 3-phosphoshikimate 1-carboxyvinyltransferase [Acidimicrobiales bacterium]|nr:3-phosphoshikimate 1-carboxyvinyltransferase [Acidimicrobiales bacterium]
MTELRVSGGRPLRGRVRVPGDKSISHRAVLLAARAEGTSVVRGLSTGDDVAHTLGAVEALGAEVDGRAGDPETHIGGGAARLHEAETVLDVGNSGTGIRLLAGFCAPFDWLTVLTGDRSVAQRPMDRVAEPLRAMGAAVDGRDGGRYPPLVVRGGGLHGIDYTPPVASAQVKSAVLLAGLGAEGDTVVREPVATRAHTEELLAACGADLEVTADSAGGCTIRLRPSQLEPFSLDVPGDPSQAAFWVVAACITPGSDVVVDDVYLGPARAGFVDVLLRMGADVERVGESALRARYRPLRGTDVTAEEIPGLVDEVPVLAVAAAVAQGPSQFGGAAELRVKESDRIATVSEGLRAFGAVVETKADGFVVAGGTRLAPARTSAQGDHRVAMAMAVAAMAAEAESLVAGWEAVATSYPGFERDLAVLTGEADGRAGR